MRCIIVLVFVVSLTSGHKKKSGNSFTWNAIFKGFESFVHNGVLPLELPLGNGNYFRVELPLHPGIRGNFPDNRQMPNQMSPVDRRAFPPTDHGVGPVKTHMRANGQSPMGIHAGNNVINQANRRVLPQGVHPLGVNQRPGGALPGNSQFDIGHGQIPVGMAMNIPQHAQFPLGGVANNLYPVKEREWTGQMPDLGGVNPINNPMPEQFQMGTPVGIAPNEQFPARPNVDMNIRNPIARGDFPGELGNGQIPGIINPGNIHMNQLANQFPSGMPINMIPNGQTAPGTDIGNNMINPIDRANSPGSFIPSGRRPRPVKFNQIKNEMHEMTNAITPPEIQLSFPENSFPENSVPTSNMINPQFPVFQPERIQPAGMHMPNNEILPNIHKLEHKHKMRVLPMWNKPIDRSHMPSAMNPNTNNLFPAHTPGSNPIIRQNQNQPLPRRRGVSPGEWLRPDGNNLILDVPQPDRGIIKPSEQLSPWWPINGGNLGVPFHPDYLNPISHTNGKWKRMWKKKGGY